MNDEKMSEINSILDKKIINLIEFKQTFNFYNNFTQKNKNTFLILITWLNIIIFPINIKILKRKG